MLAPVGMLGPNDPGASWNRSARRAFGAGAAGARLIRRVRRRIHRERQVVLQGGDQVRYCSGLPRFGAADPEVLRGRRRERVHRSGNGYRLRVGLAKTKLPPDPNHVVDLGLVGIRVEPSPEKRL